MLYNLIEYSNNYLNTSRRLWQYYRDRPPLNSTDNVIDFTGTNDKSKL